MSIDALRRDLAQISSGVTVEERGRVAVVVAAGGEPLDAPMRRRLVSLARTHGFSNVCVELAPIDANLSGD